MAARHLEAAYMRMFRSGYHGFPRERTSRITRPKAKISLCKVFTGIFWIPRASSVNRISGLMYRVLPFPRRLVIVTSLEDRANPRSARQAVQSSLISMLV
jgi:hypothetical protein